MLKISVVSAQLVHSIAITGFTFTLTKHNSVLIHPFLSLNKLSTNIWTLNVKTSLFYLYMMLLAHLHDSPLFYLLSSKNNC